MAGYIGSKAVNLSTTGADINGDANIDGNLSFRDNDKVIFGAGSDLQIYHDGANSYITEGGVGDLRLGAANIRIGDNTSGASYIYATQNAEVTLYHNNSPKLATTSTGVDITGTLTSDGLTVDGTATIRDDAATTSYYSTDVASNVVTHTSNGTGAFAQEVWKLNDGGTPSERMRLTTTGLGIGTSSPSVPLHIDMGADNNALYIQSSDQFANIGLIDGSGSGKIIMDSGELSFTTGGDATTSFTGSSERMRIDSSGNLLVGRTTLSGTDNSSGSYIFNEGAFVAQRSSNVNLYLNRYGTDGDIALFRKDGTTVGSISITSSGTTYNTTSDLRLKDNIEPIADATEKLMSMKPVTHTWIADPDADAVFGFIAQEMQEIVPEAVSGDPDGEEMMSMDYGRITPVLVAALQEATNEIKALKQRVSELEAK